MSTKKLNWFFENQVKLINLQNRKGTIRIRA